MVNNQMLQLINQLRTAQNPQMMLNQMLGNDPTYQKAVQMVQGKSGNEMRAVAENLCQQRGINLQEFVNSFMRNMR